MIYRLIWKDNDKIKRAGLINDIEDSALKMLDIQLMILTHRVMVLKRFADREKKGPWKITLSYFLSQVGGDLFSNVILTLESCLFTFQPFIKSVWALDLS